jgi:HlyD family secretion protein
MSAPEDCTKRIIQMVNLTGRILSRATLFTLLIGQMACDPFDDQPRAVGTLERDRIRLVSDSSEPILTIRVAEGDRVEIGEVLVEQSTERFVAQYDHAKALEQAAGAKLNEAEKGPRAQQIEQGRARLAAASSSVHTARLEVERTRSLVERNFFPQNRLDVLEGRLDEAIARHSEAQAALEELLEGTRSEEIDRARADYAAAKTGVTDLSITLDRATITAPLPGVIEALPYEVGERPHKGADLVIMRVDKPTYARVHIPETIRTRLSVGADAVVHIDGHASPYHARIRWISTEAAFTPFYALTQFDRSHLSYLAEIDLVESPDLPVGIPVEVYFPGISDRSE